MPPRWGNLTREVLAVNMVLAGCTPAYAPVIHAAILALCSSHFNLNGVQATTHMAAPLLVVNGPVRGEIGMNAGANVFGSGNRANATIGRAIRLVLLNVGGAWPGDLDKSTLGHPGKYTFCIAENEEASPWAPYHVEQGYRPEDSAVFCIATEGPHSVTNHVADDPQGVLDSLVSAMSTIAHNNAVSSGSCAVVIDRNTRRPLPDEAGRGATYDATCGRTRPTPSTTSASMDATGRSTTATYRSGTDASPGLASRSCRRRTTSICSSPVARLVASPPFSLAGGT